LGSKDCQELVIAANPRRYLSQFLFNVQDGTFEEIQLHRFAPMQEWTWDNKAMRERVIMTRLVRGRAPGREFDIAFWQALGPNRIFEAAWDLVVTAAATKGVHEDQLRLQRSVTKLERGRRPLPDRGGLRGDGTHGTALHEGSRPLD